MGATLERPSDVIADIVRRARPFNERLSSARDDAWTDELSSMDASRVAAWCAVVSNGDVRSFERRLSWDNLDARVVARALDERASADHVASPPWADTLAAAFNRDQVDDDTSLDDALVADRACSADAPLPFEGLLLPLVVLGRTRVAERAGAACELLSDCAHASMERALLARLTAVCARALHAEFSVFRSCRQQASFASLFAGGTNLYAAFCADLRGGGLLEFFNEYSVAARLCATVTDSWVDATAELVTRLAADLPSIEQTFNRGKPLGVAATIRAGVSDPHEGGRGVAILRWDTGTTVVYKPRPVGLETCFRDLVQWVNAEGALDLRALAVVARPTHGWIEFASHTPCENGAAAERFFERCGMLLCLAYVLNGSDFHYENLIAAGEHPMLIDMETLLGHRFELAENLADQALSGRAARQRSMESVLNVRLLPLLKVADGQAFEVGGLGGPSDAGGAGPQATAVSYWKSPNTDAMKLDRIDAAMAPGADNLPVVNGSRVQAAGHVSAIVSGFARAYRTMLSHVSELLSADGPLAAFRRQEVRFILRNTSLYAGALERCLHPRFLRDGIDRGVQLDVLSRVFLTLDARPAVWPIVEAERCALEQMDIPLFTARADSTSLTLPTGVTVQHCFRASAFDEVVARVGRLSASDLEAQCEIIRGSFRANAVHGLVAPVGESSRVRKPIASGVADPSRFAARAIETATRVATELRNASLGGEREGSWLGVSYLAEVRRYMLGPMSSNLFDGYAGIALFFAALEQVSGGRAGFRAIALSTAAPLRSRLDELEQSARMRRSVDVGAATGLGGLVYSLVRIGEFLNEPDFLRDASRIATLITPATVDVADSLDVVSGSAGAILGLLTLHSAAPNSGALDLAAAMAARLLDRRIENAQTGMQVFPTLRGRAEPGFAHGQAGIAYALSRLAHARNDAALRDAALEAIESERILLGDHLGAAEAMESRAAWSHGATGVGLARLGGESTADVPAVRAEVDVALEIARRHLLDGVDSLCCGAVARLDFLVSAANRLNRPELLDVARDAASSLIDRADANGGYDSGWVENGFWQAGLFHGAPGMCYTLLRLAHPTVLPSLLLWA